MSLGIDKSTWERVTFGDVTRNVNETVKDAAAAAIDRIIALEHMDPGELKINRWGNTADGTTFTRRVRPGQTLFGKRRAYQRKVAYAEFDAICSGDIYTFEANETRMLGEFLPFLVQSDPFFEHALGTSAGSLSPRTNWRDLASFEFTLPPLNEQKRIAELLWAMERHRLALVGLLAQVEAARTARVGELGRRADTSELLGNVLTKILDRRGITPKKLGGEFVSAGVPVISAMNIVDGRVDHARQERYVTEAIAERWMSDSLRTGDILMTSEAPLGSTVLVHADTRACLGQRLFALRPNPERVLPEYLLAWLASGPGRKALEERASGTTVKGIRQAELVKVELPMPPPSAQREFVRRWSEAQSARDELLSQLAKLAVLRSTILAELFGDN